jgi:hypothetical protein
MTPEPCALTPDEPACRKEAVVSVIDGRSPPIWGCEEHAAEALDQIRGSRLGEVDDWPAATRLLLLPWNRRVVLDSDFDPREWGGDPTAPHEL